MTQPRPRVFVVDDEEMVCTALASLLELEMPYEVIPFTSPAEALQTLQGSDALHLVVSDFMMPGMDGVAFLRAVREARPLATRILLTGYADKENAIRAINEAGLYQYLEKPWRNDDLMIHIRNGVERAALLYDLEDRVAALATANEELQEIRRRLMRAFL